MKTNIKMPPWPRTRPRTKPPEVRRRGLMDAAERLFLAQGIAATSVDAIVNRKRLTRALQTFFERAVALKRSSAS
jgi:Bacterial regulatory proteins, tetR family